MMPWRKTQTDSVQSIFDGAYQTFPDGPQCYRPAMLDATLRALFQSAVNHAQSRIDWYSKNAKKKASAAKHLRRLSLILFATGTIAPISVAFFMQISEKLKFETLALLPLAEVGYILLAFAGALVIFDQFFDSSGSWIRFRQSEARL